MGKLFLGLMIGLMMSVQLFACNINTASVEELCELKGIGKGTAEKIVEYRQQHKFQSIDELKQIKGIGEKKFDAIKDELSV